MLEGIDLATPNILLSGAADGADSAFGKAAVSAKPKVVHWTFAGHKTKLRKNLYQLRPEHLTSADPYLIRANKSLRRRFPTSNNHTDNLLRRNFYQVRYSESVYAVSNLVRDSSMLGIQGGTAWACQMYVDTFLYDQIQWDLCKLYLYDQVTNSWYVWCKMWERIDAPPMPAGIYAGIGSRDLTESGLAAINALYSK